MERDYFKKLIESETGQFGSDSRKIGREQIYSFRILWFFDAL